MKDIALKARKRSTQSKGEVKRLRKSGFIPAIIYGENIENRMVELNYNEFYMLFHRNLGSNIIFSLQVDGENEPEKVIVRDIQYDVVSDNIIHVDFQYISMDKEITINIPVELLGIPMGVKDGGGILQNILRELHVLALPKDVPEKVSIDVSDLKIGDSVHVRDVKIENVNILNKEENVVVNVIAPKVEKEKEEVVEEEAEKEPEVIGEKKEEGAEAKKDEGKDQEKGKEKEKKGKDQEKK